MTGAAFFLIGVAIGGVISDIVLAVRIYRTFRNQSIRKWPGAGWWMAWKTPVVLKMARTRLANIHAAATMFPLGSHHSDATREFVQVIAKASEVGSKPEAAK